MLDCKKRRHTVSSCKRALWATFPYLQKQESFLVSFELQVLVLLQCILTEEKEYLVRSLYVCVEPLRSGKVHLNGMIDDQVDRTNGIDFFRVSAQFLDCVPHGCKVHYSRYARKVL